MNLTTLTNYAAQFAADVAQTRYSGQFISALNEAQVQFALDTRILYKDLAISLVAGTATYALPIDFMFEKQVQISQDNNTQGGILLDPISRARLEFYTRDHDWQDDNGTPKFYIIDPELAREQIRFYPNPQGADAGTNNAVLTYYPYPTALVNPTDIPLNGNTLMIQFHIALAAYAAWLLLLGEPSTDDIIKKREALYKLYQDRVTQAIDRFGNSVSEQIRLVGGRIWH